MSRDATVDAFKRLPTAAISDAMDRLGIPGQALGMAPLDVRFRLAGRAFTIRYRPIGAVEKGTVGDYIDDVPPGEVVVLDNAGRLDCTVGRHSHCRRASAWPRRDGDQRRVSRRGAGDRSQVPIYSKGRYMRTGRTASR
jgi:regulator of RNase E activity RraA